MGKLSASAADRPLMLSAVHRLQREPWRRQPAACSSALCINAVCRPSSEPRRCFIDVVDCAGSEGITLTTQGDGQVPH